MDHDDTTYGQAAPLLKWKHYFIKFVGRYSQQFGILLQYSMVYQAFQLSYYQIISLCIFAIPEKNFSFKEQAYSWVFPKQGIRCILTWIRKSLHKIV